MKHLVKTTVRDKYLSLRKETMNKNFYEWWLDTVKSNTKVCNLHRFPSFIGVFLYLHFLERIPWVKMWIIFWFEEHSISLKTRRESPDNLSQENTLTLSGCLFCHFGWCKAFGIIFYSSLNRLKIILWYVNKFWIP